MAENHVLLDFLGLKGTHACMAHHGDVEGEGRLVTEPRGHLAGEEAGKDGPSLDGSLPEPPASWRMGRVLVESILSLL